ncbi:MAG: HipA family kinase [Jatrophihabitantaceae bacterium]
MIGTVQASRYVTPLREGGSLPGIVEADDLGTYVVKFRGAGQGLKALVAEVVVGELGRRLGLRVPEMRALELDPMIARYEADQEVQDLLNASVGLNLAVDFLPGSFGWDAGYPVDPAEAARILWLDAFTANVDRSWRNPNLLLWHRQLWLIDHGAALYFHHGWSRPGADPQRFARQPYDAAEHVLVGYLSGVAEADRALAALVARRLLADVLDQVPDEWLEPDGGGDGGADAVRQRYLDYLLARLAGDRSWLPRAAAA